MKEEGSKVTTRYESRSMDSKVLTEQGNVLLFISRELILMRQLKGNTVAMSHPQMGQISPDTSRALISGIYQQY